MVHKSIVDLIPWLEDIFEKHNVDRSYGGAISRNFWAEPRHTIDIDVLISVTQITIPALVSSLAANCQRVITDNAKDIQVPLEIRGVLEDIRGKGKMSVLLCWGIKVEMFVPFHPFHHAVLKRSIPRELGARKIKVHSPEDLIVFKKMFDRSKDKEDIKAILASNPGKLDTARIIQDASQFLERDSLDELELLIKHFYRA